MNLKPEAANRTQRSLERHGETNWYEWTLREFLRYLFGLGVLALIVFVPLQIQLSWLPSNAPPVYDPSLVAVLTVIAFVLIGVGGLLAYRALWGDDGVVERNVARHRRASSPVGVPPTARP
ncbi:MAG TPA: hypothetical protein VEO18_08310 [Thermoplasmata archaeon]|nr:hypothetical protein [Thermoplasmata archaeon]